MTVNRQLRVFLCHSSDDKPGVRDLYEKLTARGIDAWLDEKKLIPGQPWKIEIPKAVREADAVIICLSKTSITKEGFVQKEIKFALDIALEKPEGTIYLIPARLEECKVPDSLSDWHWVNLFDKQGLDLVFRALQVRAKSLGLSISNPPSKLVGRVSNPTEPLPFKSSQTKNLLYKTSVQEKKFVFEAPLTPLSEMPTADWIEKNKLVLSNGMEFMRVPAGKFIMGSNNGSDKEKPQHAVDILYDYWMARYPVTNEQYNVHVYSINKYWQKKKDHPVVNVSWDDVVEYCNWLNTLLKAELPSGLALRLPTEAEWEKAARGTDGREYPWGNAFDKNKCNSSECGKGGTTPVGMYSPHGDSPYECADMSGNVWEWAHSKKKAYPYKPKDGREGEQKSALRVLRGGAFDNRDRNVSCSCRTINSPSDRSSGIGFRVVVAPPFHPSHLPKTTSAR